MFKLIFKATLLLWFLIFITAALAIWKGGEPFRYFGEGVIVVGNSIMKFGDFVDEFIAEGKSLRKSYDKLKDIVRDDNEEEASRERQDNSWNR